MNRDRGATFPRLVIKRDGQCVECGSTKNLQAHHIIPISIGGSDEPDNGKALCAECHAGRHPDIPRGLFLAGSRGAKISGDWNATSLAALLRCHPRSVVRAAKKLGIEREGHTWTFYDDEIEIFKQIIRLPNPNTPEKSSVTIKRLTHHTLNRISVLTDKSPTEIIDNLVAAEFERLGGMNALYAAAAKLLDQYPPPPQKEQ